jgi:hypothetical protein
LSCYLFGIFTVLYVDFATVTFVLWPWMGASVAGALNGALHVQDCGDSAIPALERARSAGKASQSSGRVMEQDVIDYYCRWSRESGRIACHAALRGSCGLIPSTRKIGNPRLIRACHAVGASFLSNELSRNRERQNSEAASNGSLVCLPKVSKKPATTIRSNR